MERKNDENGNARFTFRCVGAGIIFTYYYTHHNNIRELFIYVLDVNLFYN